MSQTRCIYCFEAKDGTFNADHVIPQSFEKFEQNFTLFCVCNDCNQYFGNELELFLARDSGEALLRFYTGVKDLKEIETLRRDRLTIIVDSPGSWFGATVVLRGDPKGEKLECKFLPQVGFQRANEGKVWILEKDLTPGSTEQFGKDVKINIIGDTDEDLKRVKSKLAEVGINFEQQGVLDDPVDESGKIKLTMEMRVDQIILRAIAKIAFNYLAYTQGDQFALYSDFNPIRKYIRYGERPTWNPVQPTREPLLVGDSKDQRQTNGHLLTLDWRSGEAVIAQVSLFNNAKYIITLCAKFSGVWRDIQTGHHFDIGGRTISKLGGARLIKPVTMADLIRARLSKL